MHKIDDTPLDINESHSGTFLRKFKNNNKIHNYF